MTKRCCADALPNDITLLTKRVTIQPELKKANPTLVNSDDALVENEL